MYDKEKILAECVKAIEEEKLTFFTDVVEFIEPSLGTLYEWEFEKSEAIKNALAKNKIAAKRKLRKQWQIEGSAPALQLAAYKLMADKEELEALTMNKVESSGSLTINWKEERTYETK